MKKVERLVPHEGHGWGAEMESSEGWVEGTPTYVSSEDYDALVEEYNKLALVAETPEGVKIYRLSSNGDYSLKIAVTKDGKQVSIAQH